MKYDARTLSTWVERIEVEADLNDWEEQFITSVKARLVKGQELTPAMEEKLEQIYANKTK